MVFLGLLSTWAQSPWDANFIVSTLELRQGARTRSNAAFNTARHDGLFMLVLGPRRRRFGGQDNATDAALPTE